jgi:hypothetical protein
MVLAVTILFMVLALNSLLPRPDWLYNLFRKRVVLHSSSAPRKRH